MKKFYNTLDSFDSERKIDNYLKKDYDILFKKVHHSHHVTPMFLVKPHNNAIYDYYVHNELNPFLFHYVLNYNSPDFKKYKKYVYIEEVLVNAILMGIDYHL